LTLLFWTFDPITQLLLGVDEQLRASLNALLILFHLLYKPTTCDKPTKQNGLESKISQNLKMVVWHQTLANIFLPVQNCKFVPTNYETTIVCHSENISDVFLGLLVSSNEASQVLTPFSVKDLKINFANLAKLAKYFILGVKRWFIAHSTRLLI